MKRLASVFTYLVLRRIKKINLYLPRTCLAEFWARTNGVFRSGKLDTMKWKVSNQLHLATAIGQVPKSQVVRDISLFRRRRNLKRTASRLGLAKT